MTVNVLDPENGDCLQSLTFCEILLPHISRGCLLVRGTRSLHRSLKLVRQSSTLFSLLFMAITFDDTTIKHSIYTQKVPFQCTEKACVVFSSFEIHCKKGHDVKRCKFKGPEGVAKGFSQIPGLDFTHNFSPVVNDVTF